MPIIGAIVVLIQFCFAFHVLKTGRPYWWLFVVMAFPVMGCIIYYFVEVFPDHASTAGQTRPRAPWPGYCSQTQISRSGSRNLKSAAASTTRLHLPRVHESSNVCGSGQAVRELP